MEINQKTARDTLAYKFCRSHMGHFEAQFLLRLAGHYRLSLPSISSKLAVARTKAAKYPLSNRWKR
jgi:hypothetical protein